MSSSVEAKLSSSSLYKEVTEKYTYLRPMQILYWITPTVNGSQINVLRIKSTWVHVVNKSYIVNQMGRVHVSLAV
jgi:hypothetical protein